MGFLKIKACRIDLLAIVLRVWARSGCDRSFPSMIKQVFPSNFDSSRICSVYHRKRQGDDIKIGNMQKEAGEAV